MRWVLVTALALVASTPALAAPTLFTSTVHVEALAVSRDTLWAATRGGLEAWDVVTLTRRRLYTTLDGLDENHVRAVAVSDDMVEVRTSRAACALAGERLTCTTVAAPLAPAPSPQQTSFQGARVTADIRHGNRRFVGTAGRGLWLAGPQTRQLTPRDQICSNHAVAVARFGGRLWFASFDEGLCSFDGRRFVRARLPVRMTNDLLATRDALYVATTKGLFVTRDGRRFSRVPGLDGRGVVDLAADDRHLWAVTPASLWRLPLRSGLAPTRGYWQPAGARALQAVDVRGGVVWVATEDRGVLRLGASGQFEILDRAAGLPTSWTLDVVATADGGAFVATLRHGLVRIGPDGSVRPVADGALDPWLLHVSGGREGTSLFVGTQGGAAVVDGDTETVNPVPHVPHPCVHAVLATDEALWVATEGGTLLVLRE